MRLGRVIEERFDREVGIGLADFLCYSNGKSALWEIRKWCRDDVRFIDFVNLFAGSYIVCPSGKKLLRTYHIYMTALAIRKIQIARKKKDLLGWSEQEALIVSTAKKMGLTYRSLYLKGSQALKRFTKIKDWMLRMKTWESKYMRGKHEDR